jgi:flagellin
MAVVGTNPSALNATFYLNIADGGLAKSIKRLSSGSKLVDPSDDAAGVAVSSKLDATIRRISAASEGAQNLISFAQTADSFLKVIQDQLTRMSELATRATNGAFSASDRANYNTEFAKLQSNILNQITNAKFNGTRVFDGSQTVSATVSNDATNIYTLTIANALMNVSDITGTASTNISTASGATSALAALTTALGYVASSRATVNADVSAVTFYISNLEAEKINTEAANSRIKDLDFAGESTMLAKFNILNQAATAMLAQANTTQQSVLGLLQ